MLLLLAAMWGASYLFIKVAVEDIPPAAMTDLRLAIAAVLLTAYLMSTTGRAALTELRRAWVPCLVLGIINAALPMTLVAWGETHIDSSIAGIAQASVPIFVAILGLRFLPHDPLRGGQMIGLAVGLSGVALITGVHPDGGWWAVAGTFAVVLSSLSYASGGIYGQLRVHDTPGPVLASGIDDRRRNRAPALRHCRSADTVAWHDCSCRSSGAGADSDLPRTAAPLSDASTVRQPQALARDVPDARVRCRLRRTAARRARQRGRARRSRADPRRVSRSPPGSDSSAFECEEEPA